MAAQHMMVPLIGLVLTLLVTSSNGWLFSRRYPTARAHGKGVDNSCIAKAMEGSCDFYVCFEKRLPCGRKWYNQKYGDPYCRDFKAFASKFSIQGKKFLNASQQCITKELLTWYERDSINCHDYTHFAVKTLSRCFMKTGFCGVVGTEAINFVAIFRPQHLFQRGAFKLWREILQLAYYCDPKLVSELIAYLWQSIAGS